MRQFHLEALIKGLQRHHEHGTFNLLGPCQHVKADQRQLVGYELMRSEAELFQSDCGVNLYGVIALLPEFLQDGGYAERQYGLPRIGGYSASFTVPKWLGILADDLRIVTSGGAGAEYQTPEYYSSYYNKKLGEVTALDVIQLLTEFDRGYKAH